MLKQYTQREVVMSKELREKVEKELCDLFYHHDYSFEDEKIAQRGATGEDSVSRI